jgi:hypothetical protein
MRTGDDAMELGLYASECCSVEKTFKVGDCFSRCPKCESLCVWEEVETIIPQGGFEKVEHEAA